MRISSSTALARESAFEALPENGATGTVAIFFASSEDAVSWAEGVAPDTAAPRREDGAIAEGRNPIPPTYLCRAHRLRMHPSSRIARRLQRRRRRRRRSRRQMPHASASFSERRDERGRMSSRTSGSCAKRILPMPWHTATPIRAWRRRCPHACWRRYGHPHGQGWNCISSSAFSSLRNRSR